ncbi:hypothetical protein EV424DRAFT_1422961, partial [Suillus variegatus]
MSCKVASLLRPIPEITVDDIMSSAVPRLAVVAAGAMGAAVAKRLTSFGCTVYTNLDGRSEDTRKRAQDAGMIDLSVDELVLKSDWILSILPPRDAVSFAEKIQEVAAKYGRALPSPQTFVDCNAVNPETVKRIAALFSGTSIRFVDAGIIGGPPKGDQNLSKYGLKLSPLKGKGVGIGDASALKMSYAVSWNRQANKLYVIKTRLTGNNKGNDGIVYHDGA